MEKDKILATKTQRHEEGLKLDSCFRRNDKAKSLVDNYIFSVFSVANFLCFWWVVETQAEGVLGGFLEHLRNGRMRKAYVGNFLSSA